MTKTTPQIKTNMHTIFHTDNNLEEEGAWVTVNDLQKLKIKVRRHNSDAAIKSFNKTVIELFGEGKLRNPQSLTEAEIEEIELKQLAESILIDWSGLKDEDGNEIPYSVEMAVELLRMGDFRDFVTQASKERDAFRESNKKDSVKNS